MPGDRINRNSDVSMQQRFKYAVSKKSKRSKPSKINWMPQSDVTLAVAKENETTVIKLQIVKPNLAFTVTKNNICGLETGKIIAPGSLSTCWRSKQQSSPYLLIVYVEDGLSQMILLLNSNSDDDEVTKRWKWKIQTNLGFAKSWPNLDIVYENGAHTRTTDRVTLMLGKEWLAFFMYVSDSLPTFWKRFDINKISDLKLHNHQTIPGKSICVITVVEKENKGKLEYSIISGRSQEIYSFIESYKNNTGILHRRELPLPDFHNVPSSSSSVSPQTSVSCGQRSSSSCMTSEVQLYPVDVHDLVRRQVKMDAVEDIYIHPQKVHIGCPKNVPHSPDANLPDATLPAPSPCGSLKSEFTIKDMGYIDRPYMAMDKPYPYKQSVAIPVVTKNYTYNPQPLLNLKMGYITLPPSDQNQTSETVVILKEEINRNDPFRLVVRQTHTLHLPEYDVIPGSYPGQYSARRRYPFEPMETINSLENTPSIGNADTNSMLSLKEDIPTSCYISSQFVSSEEDPNLKFDFEGTLKNVHQKLTLSSENLSPPSPCRQFRRSSSAGWGNHSEFFFHRSRSESEVDGSIAKQSAFYSTAVLKKFNKWATNCTLPKDTEKFIKEFQYFSDVNQFDLGNGDEGTYDSVSSGAESDDECSKGKANINNFDLNMLTFPINNLNKKEKEDVFLWMNNILTIQQKNQSGNVSEEDNTTCSQNISEQLEGNTPYRHNVRMRRSASHTNLHEKRTSSMIYGYWSASKICRTLDKVMRNKPPLPDTLHISIPVRRELCLRLYTTPTDTGKHDWEALAGFIGLTADCVSVIELCIRNHALKYTAAEIVLRHWQFIYNKYWKNGKENIHKCPEPCTKDRLVYILDKKLQRHDLVELLTSDDGGINRNTDYTDDRTILKVERQSSYIIDDDLFGNDSLINTADENSETKLQDQYSDQNASTTDFKKHFEVTSNYQSDTDVKQDIEVTSYSYSDTDVKQDFEGTPSVITVQKSHSISGSIVERRGNSIRRIDTYNLNGKNILLSKGHRKSYV